MSDLIGALRSVGITQAKLEKTAAAIRTPGHLKTFAMKKRHGGHRLIHIPSPDIDTTLKRIKRAFTSSGVLEPADCVHGHVLGRNIVTNARAHLGQPALLNLDLTDFFGSKGISRVKDDISSWLPDATYAKALEACVLLDDKLPLGFSTSPFLSNAAFASTDIELIDYADGAGLVYSRYVDDLTFSGEPEDAHLEAITAILTANSWGVNPTKTRFMRRGGPQYVTGLYVGDPRSPRIPRAVKRRLRQRLYYMAKYGYSKDHENDWMFHNQAFGWIRHIAQVERGAADRFLAMAEAVDFSDDSEYWNQSDDWDDWLEDVW